MTLRSFLLATAFAFLFGWEGRAAETAHGRLYCTSLHFSRAEDDWGSSLELTTINTGYNGELITGLDNAGSPVGSAYFALDYLGGYPIEGSLQVAMPDPVDTNGNGFDDFFEVAQPANFTTTRGRYATMLGGGTISATWNRSAGSKDGTCVLSLQDDAYGSLGSFTHSFEVIEYTGQVPFTPATNTVSAGLDLAQTGNPANRLTGPLQFVKNPTNRFDELTLQAGVLTNAALQPLSFTEQIYNRDAAWPTNYYGWFNFADGEPATAEPDYTWWVLLLDDAHDANRNGIPDFSDDPALRVPRAPTLALRGAGESLTLTIAGEVGYAHQIQEAALLPSSSWATVLTVTLTNDPQVVTLPKPAATRFWRAVAQ